MGLTFALLLAAAAGSAGFPPGDVPLREAIRCHAVSMAYLDVGEPNTGGALKEQSIATAIVWGVALSMTARREGVAVEQAEAESAAERTKLKPLLAAGEPAARSLLATCRQIAYPDS